MDENKLIEIRTGGEEIYRGIILNLLKDTVTLPNGRSASREYLKHNGAVGIVAVDAKGRVCVERQYRYPINEIITEIPAGKRDTPDEDPLEGAKRELREETGYTADSWRALGTYYPAAAYSSEKVYLFLAEGLHEGEQELDEGEFLNYEFVPLSQLVEDVMNDKIPDGKSQAGILRAAKLLEK